MTKERLTRIGEITERTVIPVSLLIVIVGGIAWLANMAAIGDANTKAILEIKQKQDEYMKTVQSIDSRLSHIEGVLSK